MDIIFSQSTIINLSTINPSIIHPYKPILENIIKKYSVQENHILFLILLEPLLIRNDFIDFELLKKPDEIPIFFERTQKFENLKRILSNIFLKDSQKREFIELFSILQKGFLGLSRFIYLYRYNKSRIYNTTGLCGDLIPVNNPRLSIILYQNNTRYTFLLRELLKTINTALSNTTHFFSEPLFCKNPYTNLPFNKSALYNIYFAIRFSSSLKIPELFHRFFLCDFNLHEFFLRSDEEIREEHLKSYIQDIGNHLKDNIRSVVHHIFRENKILCLYINRDFPENRLLEIMRPYLELYYKEKYSLKRSYSNHLKVLLQYSLLKFIKHNRYFGRKISTRQKINGLWKRVDIFNEKHIVFKYPLERAFIDSHLSYSSKSLAIMMKEIRESRNLRFLRIPTPLNKDSEDEESDGDDENPRRRQIEIEDEEEELEQEELDQEELDEEQEIMNIISNENNNSDTESDYSTSSSDSESEIINNMD
jgi:hypothetical protein